MPDAEIVGLKNVLVAAPSSVTESSGLGETAETRRAGVHADADVAAQIPAVELNRRRRHRLESGRRRQQIGSGGETRECEERTTRQNEGPVLGHDENPFVRRAPTNAALLIERKIRMKCLM